MPRFAISRHDWPQTHWDLFLEADEVCKTWRLLAEPGWGKRIPAEAIADHRLEYLSYSGPISNSRGTVQLVWHGDYVSLSDQPCDVYIFGPNGNGFLQIANDDEGCVWARFHEDVE